MLRDVFFRSKFWRADSLTRTLMAFRYHPNALPVFVVKSPMDGDYVGRAWATVHTTPTVGHAKRVMMRKNPPCHVLGAQLVRDTDDDFLPGEIVMVDGQRYKRDPDQVAEG